MKKKRAWFLSWEGIAKTVPTEAAAVEALLKQYGWGMGEFTLDVSMASDKHERRFPRRQITSQGNALAYIPLLASSHFRRIISAL
jgi:hypothetical protein